MPVTVDIDDSKVQAVIGAQVRAWVEAKTAAVLDEAKANSNVRTGAMRDGTTSTVEQSRTTVTGTVTVPFPGAIIARGSRPHIIRARNARMLRFPSRSTGAIVYARQVNHPGTQAYPYLRNALLDVMYRST